MDQVVSMSVGTVCSTEVQVSPLLFVGVTEVAAAGLGLGVLSIITQLHPDP